MAFFLQRQSSHPVTLLKKPPESGGFNYGRSNRLFACAHHSYGLRCALLVQTNYRVEPWTVLILLLYLKNRRKGVRRF